MICYTQRDIYERKKPSLHENCHHQIIYARFNLQIRYPHLTKGLIDWNKLIPNKNVKNQVKYIKWHTIQNFFKLCYKLSYYSWWQTSTMSKWRYKMQNQMIVTRKSNICYKQNYHLLILRMKARPMGTMRFPSECLNYVIKV